MFDRVLLVVLMMVAATAAPAQPAGPARSEAARPIGLTVTISDAGATVISIQRQEVGELGIEAGDVITDAGGLPVRAAADLETAIAAARRRNAPVLLRIRHRDGSAAFVPVPVGG